MLSVYGIPTCQTVKKALRWLDQRAVRYRFVDLRQEPPSPEQVQRWVDAFGARALRNTSGGAYRALGPEKAEWGDARWTRAFAEDPMLLKRPIIERGAEPVKVGFRGSDDQIANEVGAGAA